MTQELITDLELLRYDTAVEAVAPLVRDDVRKGVSERMIFWMGDRDIVKRSGIVEYHATAGLDAEIATNQWPIQNVTVKHNREDIDVAKLRIDGPGGIITQINSQLLPVDWSVGEAEVTYDGGYDEVPIDLKQLAAMQCIAELMYIDQRFLGLRQRDPETGATLILERGGQFGGQFLPVVEAGIRPYRRAHYGF